MTRAAPTAAQPDAPRLGAALAWLAGASLAGAGAGCSSPSASLPAAGGGAVDAMDGGDDGDRADGNAAPPPTYAPTYSAVWDEILQPTCALLFCHGSSSDYLLLPNKAAGYASLVNAPAMGPICEPTGLVRVDPGHPETSLVYLKVTSPPCGARMPVNYGNQTLNLRQIQQIGDWITAGALND